MAYNVIVTGHFDKRAKPLLKKYRSLKQEIATLIDDLSESPMQGSRISDQCYKIRLSISSKGKGKSGGARVITCIKVEDENVFLLSIYDKSDQENIADDELNSLLSFYDLQED
jgi:mRNA-degrading endonuclease RelE of RelBE toxin-antitoxin system